MCENLKLLKVRRFKQKPGQCAIAASASIANFYDSKIDYDTAQYVATSITNGPIDFGLYSGEIGLLLNDLGFRKVSIISAEIDWLDFSWHDISNATMIQNLKKVNRRFKPPFNLEIKSVIRFLSRKKNKNKLIVDFKHVDYIRKAIDDGLPVILSYAWTKVFKFAKCNQSGDTDPFRGDPDEHAVVVCGYDDEGAYILDSHNELYKGPLKKYSSGRYKMLWTDLMAVALEVTIPEDFSAKRGKYELV